MTAFPTRPMDYNSAVDLSYAYFAASGLFRQGLEIERHSRYGSGKGSQELIDSGYGYTECCDDKYKNDLALLRHRRSIEHGLRKVAKEEYGERPWAPPGEWRYFHPEYIRFANFHVVGLAKKIARFAAKTPPPSIPDGMLADYAFRQSLALNLAQAYIDHLATAVEEE